MKYSQLLIPTVKEVPAEAEIPSHQLMIRAGYIRKVSSGAYTYLPLGWRSLLKVIAIVRQEMNAAGAQEYLMPILQPMELWQETGRNEVFKDILFQCQDRHGRKNVFSPTAEEVVTALVAAEVSSYKQLPINLYQIHDKFRDEFRPQYGVVRSREFIMKDAYSFDATVDGLNASYKKMYDAYCRVFSRCGLKYVIVQADSGGMGGTDTEEFMVPADFGDTLVMTEDGAYAANIEKAEVDAVVAQPFQAGNAQVAQPFQAGNAQAGKPVLPPMQEVNTPNVGSIEAVCKFLGTQPKDMIKTLIYSAGEIGKADHQVIVALVRGDHEVNESKLTQAAGGLRLEMAGEGVIRQVTGAAVGFAGPQGMRCKVGRIIIDHAVAAMAVGVTGANKTDYHVKNVVPGRDFPLAGENVVVADIRNAVEGDTYRGKPLKFSHGIEVGHVFKLGTKYSEKLGAKFLDEQQQSRPCIMGCYGIGVNRILACAIEMAGGHDDNGMILPPAIAPFEVEIVPINYESLAVRETADRIYAELTAGGVDVLLDDRDARPGVKFKDADLIGIPLRITVGEKSLKDGNVEVKRRTEPKPTLIPAGEAVAAAKKILDEMKK